MAGKGPPPNRNRRRQNVPGRGDWQVVEGFGWQHGETPEIPFEVRAATAKVWDRWMAAWFATNWMPEDLPGLYVTIGLYDQWEGYRHEPVIVETDADGKVVIVQKRDPSVNLARWMDTYGITPKGQQDRRWTKPDPKPKEQPAESQDARTASPYGHLTVAK
jgi:hypothetical protein